MDKNIDAVAVLRKKIKELRPANAINTQHPSYREGFERCRQMAAGLVEEAATDSAATVAKEGGERIAFLEARLTAIVQWLEANQRDVFSRGIWDAINAATPKPEASAATQQAGRDRNMGLLDEALHWIENSTENAPSLCGDIRKALGLPVVAPISEDTGACTARNAGVAAPDTSARELTDEDEPTIQCVLGYRLCQCRQQSGCASESCAYFDAAILAKSKGQV